MEPDFPQYWKTVVDTMMDGVVVVNRDGLILSVNPALMRMTGYEKSDLIGRDCAILDCDTCFSTGSEGEKEKMCRLFEKGSVVGHRCRIRRKDGSPLHLLKNGAVLRETCGIMIGGVETLTDITDLVSKEQTIEQLKALLSPSDSFEGIIGKSPGMQCVYELIRNTATSDAPIIIYGESGTGKELVANAIHTLGKRKDGPFVKVACAALNESLLESELFGHVKGAFTGADKDRRGRFESADKGELFLDEIGDVPLSTQVKLLRALQEKVVERVGDQTPIPIDTRVIAATHRNLERMCEERTFRDDLFYRLNVIPIELPALRERREDIPLLVDYFIKGLQTRTGKQITTVTEEALEKLLLHRWPGNIRELINVLEYAFVVCQDDVISLEHLPSAIRLGKRTVPYIDHDIIHQEEREQRERLLKALREARGNRQKASQALGISRVTLWKLMKKYSV
jgi:two-component system, NtrC family, response regulator HydG